MNTPQPHLVLLLNNQLKAWLLNQGIAPTPLLIQGEKQLPINSAEALQAAYADIGERLHGDGITPAYTNWLCCSSAQPLLVQALSRMAQPPAWQILCWSWLAERFDLPDQAPDQALLEVFAWLLSRDIELERQQMVAALARDHHTVSERLAAERQQLQRENEQLRASNAALQQLDKERLATYLPALFPRVFTILGATDLSLLCGRVEPLQLPNPYPEPSAEALHQLQRQFRALPLSVQKQIVQFVAALPHRHKLQARPEMRRLIQELEEN